MKHPYHFQSGSVRLIPVVRAVRQVRRTGALLLTALSFGFGAQAQAPASFFQTDAAARSATAASPLAAALYHSRALTADLTGLRAALATAPPEGRAAAPLVLALPLPDGGTARFAVHEAPVMAPALAAQFPQIKTYAGVGLDDAAASVRLDLSPQGFHAQVLTTGGKSFYIDPVRRTNAQHYMAFYKADMNRTTGPALTCGFAPTAAEQKAVAALVTQGTRAALPSGSELKTYRLAVAATGEYTAFHGGTVPLAQAAIVATLNRVVGVYEKELAVRLVLVPNNSLLVYTNAATDPFANTSGDLAANITTINAVIGSANYDIGHLVGTGGGGVAGLGVVCSASKARGLTGSPSPVGDAFDIDYVAHEMGHQFGGNHPFNGNAGSCAGGNRNPNTAWEPGSGTTIMAYAGICGSANDLQPNSDPYFHTGNFQEMRAFIASTTCATTAVTGNTAPVVTAPASGKTLPIGTPFKLTATATDAENDLLTYMWEEMDLGPTVAPNDPQVAGQNVPLFRSFVPLLSGTRYFPRLSSLVNNTTVIGERLPTVTRTLKFRCTARDQHSGPAGVVGGVDYSAFVNMDVTSTAGPFVLTAPNTAVSWTGGASQTVTWNVANTNVAPVSCATVNLRLSLDGGLTYPVLLAAGVPNSGTASVSVPNTTTAQARLMVESADNYFFDISNVNFAITPGPGPSITSFTPASGPVGTVVTLTGTNFTGATDVTINGTAAAFAVVSATSITATVATGTTSGLISVTTPAGTAVSATPFLVGLPPTITSFTPTTGAVGSTVVITGTSFTAASQVTFAGTNAPVFSVNSATQITVVVPNGAVTGPIAVTTPLGTGTSTTNFTVLPRPVITSFSPTTGIPGTVVTITGTNFTGATQVIFNRTAATVYTVDSPTQITATVPNGATTGRISVITPGGVASSTAVFTVQVPTITSFTPTSGPVGTVVTLTGSYFTGITSVTFNGTPATVFTVVSDTQITVTVPVGATSGPIVVTGPLGSGTSPSPFMIPPPNDQCADAIAMTCGQTVTGTNVGFTATGDPTGSCSTAIRNGGVFYSLVGNGASITVTTCNTATNFDTQVFVYSGRCGGYVCVGGNDDAGAGLTCSSVTFASQYGVNYLIFVNGYLAGDVGTFALSATCATPPATPAITSLSPTSGPVGTSVTITGSNFTGATGVKFNGVTATYTVTDAQHIDTSVPAGATTGNVVVAAGNGILSNGVVFTVTAPPAPTVTSLSPNRGAVGTMVTITGTNFTGATSLTLNGVAITGFTVVNGTTITFTIPAGATSGNVVVTTPGGSNTGTPFVFTVVTATAQALPSEFSVWPNPVAGQGSLHLKLATATTGAEVTLRTVVGQTLATRRFSGGGTELPLGGLAAGTYLLTVQAAGRAPSVQRLVVE